MITCYNVMIAVSCLMVVSGCGLLGLMALVLVLALKQRKHQQSQQARDELDEEAGHEEACAEDDPEEAGIEDTCFWLEGALSL